MWHNTQHSSHQSGNQCFDPDRDGWNRGHGHDRHHHGGWGEHGHHDRGWNGLGDCHDDRGWSGLGDCHDDRGWGGLGDCHDGHRGLINFDHNAFVLGH
jgi:hypothetical protein